MDRVVSAASLPVRSLSVALTDAPAALVSLVDRALAFERDHRWPNATTMQGAVHTARVAISADVPSVPPPEVVAPVEVRFDAPELADMDSSMGLSFIDRVGERDESGVDVSDSMLDDDTAVIRKG
jgi:hypothetical protein